MAILFYANSDPSPPSIPWVESFDGTNGSAPNTDYWTVNDGTATIQNNQLRMTESGANNVDVNFNWYVGGDFDVYVDCTVDTGPSVEGWFFILKMYIDANNYMNIGRCYYAGPGYNQGFICNGQDEGVYFESGVTNNDSPTGLGIIRSGTTWTGRYYDGGWNVLRNQTMLSGDAYPTLLNTHAGGGSPSRTVDWNNFTINAGTIGAAV